MFKIPFQATKSVPSFHVTRQKGAGFHFHPHQVRSLGLLPFLPPPKRFQISVRSMSPTTRVQAPLVGLRPARASEATSAAPFAGPARACEVRLGGFRGRGGALGGSQGFFFFLFFFFRRLENVTGPLLVSPILFQASWGPCAEMNDVGGLSKWEPGFKSQATNPIHQ